MPSNIDTLLDQLEINPSRSVVEKASKIKLVVFDVDGVLTDGTLYFLPDGQDYKAFNTRDGLGIARLLHYGIHVAVISGRKSTGVEARMKALGIQHIYLGFEHKLETYQKICQQLQLSEDQTACIGDDLIDIPLIRRAGLGVAVADAHPIAQISAHYVTRKQGGKGAARELCDLIMLSQGLLQKEIDYWR